MARLVSALFRKLIPPRSSAQSLTAQWASSILRASRNSPGLQACGEVDEWFKSHAWKACLG